MAIIYINLFLPILSFDIHITNWGQISSGRWNDVSKELSQLFNTRNYK